MNTIEIWDRYMKNPHRNKIKARFCRNLVFLE